MRTTLDTYLLRTYDAIVIKRHSVSLGMSGFSACCPLYGMEWKECGHGHTIEEALKDLTLVIENGVSSRDQKDFERR